MKDVMRTVRESAARLRTLIYRFLLADPMLDSRMRRGAFSGEGLSHYRDIVVWWQTTSISVVRYSHCSGSNGKFAV
jgi:hypothetical protein